MDERLSTFHTLRRRELAEQAAERLERTQMGDDMLAPAHDRWQAMDPLSSPHGLRAE
jgi:hypothetical protein